MSSGFLGNLGHRLKLARDLPPRLVLAKIAKRLPWSDPRSVRIVEILHSPTHRAPERLIDFFNTQEALLAERTGRRPVDFTGRRVLEIGPGPLAGWGPMAVFRGAASVVGVDPDWVDGVFDDPAVERAYLRRHHAALVAAFGPLMDYDRFRRALAERLAVVRTGLAGLRLNEPVDLVLSNSCLEHIDDLDAALPCLASHCTAGARFMHLVNFGNHRDRNAPFRTIYEMPPDAYRRHFGRHINLMRAPEVSQSFASAGIGAATIVVDSRPDLLDGVKIHSWWREHYNRETLAIRTALFVDAGDPAAASSGGNTP